MKLTLDLLKYHVYVNGNGMSQFDISMGMKGQHIHMPPPLYYLMLCSIHCIIWFIHSIYIQYYSKISIFFYSVICLLQLPLIIFQHYRLDCPLLMGLAVNWPNSNHGPVLKIWKRWFEYLNNYLVHTSLFLWATSRTSQWPAFIMNPSDFLKQVFCVYFLTLNVTDLHFW